MRPLEIPQHPDLVVGRDARDDALVWRRPDGRALVATVDVFSPIVDDAGTWGRIAAVNAVSDVYAMGAVPLFALAIAAWPRDHLPFALLGEVLAGGQDAAAADGWVVGGGHTVDASEPWYGQAVVGEVALEDVVTNAGGRPGDALVLTKALGTGLITTAAKNAEPAAIADGGRLHGAYTAAVKAMTTSNRHASRVLVDHGVTAMTDVTGFGLLGHLRSLATASNVAARLSVSAVPVLPDVAELIADGQIPAGTRRNLADVGTHLDSGGVDDGHLLVLADAQTSGGLLGAVPTERAPRVVELLAELGLDVAVIGELTDGPPGRITLTG